jgi:hypothetical protein
MAETTVKNIPDCLIINGYFILDREFPEGSELPDNWHWATPPEAVDGYQFVTLDNGKSWYATKDRGYGKPTYVAAARLMLGQYRDRFTHAERIAVDNAPGQCRLAARHSLDDQDDQHRFLDVCLYRPGQNQTIVYTQMLEQFRLLQPGTATASSSGTLTNGISCGVDDSGSSMQINTESALYTIVVTAIGNSSNTRSFSFSLSTTSSSGSIS